MLALFQFAIRFILILCLGATAIAQDNRAQTAQRTGVTITASASVERVRFTAPSSVVQIRLEVYDSTGKKLFDNEVRGGNVLDWLLQDGQAGRLAEDTYLCAVTVKTLSGKITQRIGSVVIESGSARMQSASATQMTDKQMQALGPVEEDAALTVLGEDQQQTTTVIAHDGEDGQITRGKGALSFRIGDFYRGKDIEQMRLTPEGNLGIGIIHPQARLDVDGLIRTSEGIVFPDGSIQFSAARKTFGPASLRAGAGAPHVQGQDAGLASPDTSGTGTTGKIPKWQDGPNGVLTDSNISEVNGSIGINGAPNTSFKLDVNGSVLFRGSNPGFNLVGLRPAGNTWAFQTVDDDGRFRLFGQDNVNPGVERLTISLTTGNVGIGTTAPQAKFHVNGSSWFQGDTTPLPASAGKGIVVGFGGETGYISAFDYGTFTPKNLLLNLGGGNVGIGTITPAVKLDINGSLNANSGATITGTNGDGATITARRSAGDPYVIIDSTTVSQSSVLAYRKNNFNRWLMFADNSTESGGNAGSDFRLDAYSNAGGIATHLFVNRATGNVGIGTTTPVAQLQAETSAVKPAVYGNATGAGTGVYGRSATGIAVYADGNAGQARDKGGLVKALAYINPFLPASQYVVRCYSSQQTGNAASTPPCGMTVTRFAEGFYEIDFGFRVDDRFLSITVENNIGTVGTLRPNTSNGVLVDLVNPVVGYYDAVFYIIVY